MRRRARSGPEREHGPSSWRSRWRVEYDRFVGGFRRSRLETNPRLGFIALIVVWVAGLAFGLSSGPGKTLHTVAAAILNTALISVTFGIFLYVGSNRRLARRLRTLARTEPEKLVSGESAVDRGGHGARIDVYADLARDLLEVSPVGPQLVVGEMGAGKTTALVGLARYLAERGMVPVYVSLRGVEKLDFFELARERFVEHVDAHVTTEADASRVWRWLCRSARVVVLADDLDQAQPSAAADVYEVRRALAAVRRRGLALVVTSRPVGIPKSLALSAVTLEPLDDEVAEAEVLRQVPSPVDSLAEQVWRLVRSGRLGETPFYLQITSELARIDTLPTPDENRHVVRVRLLRAYERALTERRLATEAPLGQEERRLSLRMLRALALDQLNALDADIPFTEAIATEPGADPLRLLDAAERLGAIERGPGTVRFAHEIIHSYLASTALLDDPGRLPEVCASAQTTRTLNALVLAAAGADDPAFARSACDQLLACVPSDGDDWGMAVIRAAADVARTIDDPEADAAVVRAARAYAPAGGAVAGSLTTRATLPRLARLRGPATWQLLWDFTNDPDYAVKWAAAHELRSHAVVAYDALREHFDDCLREARELHERMPAAEVDDWAHRPVFRLKMLGWVLPSLATGLVRAGRDELADDADRQWAELAALERAPITTQKGLEASVAQGLKVDALSLRGDEDATWPQRFAESRRRVLEMLDHAEFWYARVQLVHALALVTPGDAGRADVLARLDAVARSGGEHPFAAAAARLARRAVGTGDWRADIWDDEGRVVGGRCALSDEAAQLAADVTLVLNLNEQGDQAQRAAFGTWNALPHCLSGSADRGELLGRRACPAECSFKRCPDYLPTNETAYRELSKAFCRQQRRIAERCTPTPRQTITKTALKAFWQAMEERARA
jgi:hypothetical protein